MKTVIFCNNKLLTFKIIENSALTSTSAVVQCNGREGDFYYSSQPSDSGAIALKDFMPTPQLVPNLLKAISQLYWPFSTSALGLREKGIDLLLGPEDFAHGEELICFGGSFSPWHMGHAQALDAAKILRPDAHIVIIPDHNPQKMVTKTNLDVWEQWKTLATLCSHRFVYPGFLAKMCANPTAEWFPHLALRPKGLLIGGDSFLAIKTWIKYSEILQSANFLIVLPRGESDSDFKNISMQFKKEFPHLLIERLPHHPFENLSSTQIREQQ